MHTQKPVRKAAGRPSAKTATAPAKRRAARAQRPAPGAFDRFVAACLDPLPDAELVDQEFGRLTRKARAEIWRQARAIDRFYRAALDLAQASQCLSSYYPNCVTGAPWEERIVDEFNKKSMVILSKYWTSRAVALRVPAPDREAIAWKKNHRYAGMDGQLSEEEFASLLAEDEAFVAAHPARRRAREKWEGS